MRSMTLFMIFVFLALCGISGASGGGQVDPDLIPLKGKIIVVDAGHGGTDPGACKLGVKEKDITLQIALKTRKSLEKLGATVIMTRADDKIDLELEDIVRVTMAAKPDLFISIHVNSMPNSKKYNGLQTYFRTDMGHSRLFAHTVHASILKHTGAEDKRVRTAKFYVVNLPIPAVLIETGFITNDKERKNLVNPVWQQKTADGIAEGVVLYYGKKGMLYADKVRKMQAKEKKQQQQQQKKQDPQPVVSPAVPSPATTSDPKLPSPKQQK